MALPPLITHHRYLNPYEQASQGYLHQLVLVLALIIIKIHLFSKAILAALQLNEQLSLSLCSVANTYSKQLLVTYPQQMTSLMNTLLSSTLTAFEQQCSRLVHTIFAVIKALLVFYLDVFLGTYTCLLTAAISGALDIVSQTIEVATKALNTSVNSIIEELQDGLGTISSVVNGILKSANAIKSLFTGQSNDNVSSSIAQVNLTINNLHTINISADSVTQTLDQLSDDVPDFKNLTKKTVDLIAKPFESLVSEATNGSSFPLQSFPSMTNKQVINSSDICSPQALSQLHRNLTTKITNLSTYIIIAIAVCMFLVIVSLTIYHFSKYRKFNRLLDDLQAVAYQQEPTRLGDLINTYSNPILYNLSRFTWFSKMSNPYHWWLGYITSPLALTPLFIGMAGVAAVVLQLIILRALSRQISSSASTFNSWGDNLQNTAQAYFTNINDLIGSKQKSINDRMFNGVLEASDNLNSTISGFMDDLTGVISKVFGSTPLAKPLNTIVYCTIGRKVESFEKGVGWLQQNLNITIPLIPQDGLVSSLSMTAKRNDIRSFDDTVGQINSGLNKIVQGYRKSLMFELYVSLGFLGLWFLQVLIGGFLVIIKSHRADTDSIQVPSTDQKTMQPKLSHPVRISGPKPLSDLEKYRYGYPFSNPYEDKQAPNLKSRSSSRYSSILSEHTRTPV